MAKHFSYYDEWKSTVLICPKCGWQGTFDQGSVDYHDGLMDSSCPHCPWPDDPMLAIVSYPTIEEAHANWDRLSEDEKKYVERLEKSQR